MSNIFEKLQKECYFEVVNNKELYEIGLEKEDIKLPEVKTTQSAGADFFTPVDINLVPGGEVTVATGIKAHCAPYTMLCIYPRSGLGFKQYVRLANTVGIIDQDYYENKDNDGCIFVKIRNESKKELKIKKGEAFCQGIFQFYIPNRDHNLKNIKVREGGLGSTDKEEEQPKEKEAVTKANDKELPAMSDEQVLNDGTVVKTWAWSPNENTHVTVQHINVPDEESYYFSRYEQIRLSDD